jgi:hypothetical protein
VDVAHGHERVPIVLVKLLQRVLAEALLLVLGKVECFGLGLVLVPSIQRTDLDIVLVLLEELLDSLWPCITGALTERDVCETNAGIDVVSMALEQSLVHVLGLIQHALGLVSATEVVADGCDESVGVDGLIAGSCLDARIEGGLEELPSPDVALSLVVEASHVVEQLWRQKLAQRSLEFILILDALGIVFFWNGIQLHLLDLLETFQTPVGVVGFVEAGQVEQNRLIRGDLALGVLARLLDVFKVLERLLQLGRLVLGRLASLCIENVLSIQGAQQGLGLECGLLL